MFTWMAKGSHRRPATHKGLLETYADVELDRTQGEVSTPLCVLCGVRGQLDHCPCVA